MSKQSLDRNEVVSDYRQAYRSRRVSLISRREVLSGKAKFGIFGGGKELPQLALAKVFQPGDFRSGYYRDQTLMFALGVLSYKEFFAQLYADPNIENEPASGGRQMNAHFATRLLDQDGEWLDATEMYNSSADVSPTASQMPRLVGLALASKLYRQLGDSIDSSKFSNNGNEIAFGTIGNAASAEGIFWESINAISVLQAPAVVSIWDDKYGISVHNRHQFGKDLWELLSGFGMNGNGEFGFHLYSVKGWDYPALNEVYRKAADLTRSTHAPSIVHVTELTQPQGHSTSGSHERYKPAKRLAWEAQYDGLVVFRKWLIENQFLSDEELKAFEEEDDAAIESIRSEAWDTFQAPFFEEIRDLKQILLNLPSDDLWDGGLRISQLENSQNVARRDILEAVNDLLRNGLQQSSGAAQTALRAFRDRLRKSGEETYASHLYSQSDRSALLIPGVRPRYSDQSPLLNGFEILNRGFRDILSRSPNVIAFGEDLGKIGGVNQGFAGLQEAFGELRVSDTGIREATIIGQAIGLGMRGFRPIAEIQYLDYILYGLQLISDDLATLQWRSAGQQKSPVIIRTRGHRLEGVWHSGSPMGALVNLLRGIYVIVPRNMVQAIGFYNTLLASDDPGVIVEVLNAYRQKERLPENLAEVQIPLGVPEVIRQGTDLTIVTYGALCKVSMDAAEILGEMGIGVEIVDVRTLLPFDLHQIILESIKKTNRVLFLDEDVPGGATAYMMQQVMEGQGAYYWLDSAPKTLTATSHRPAYGSDGGYFSKPNKNTIIDAILSMMHEVDPSKYPRL